MVSLQNYYQMVSYKMIKIFLENEKYKRFIRFIFTGVLNTVVGLLIYSMLILLNVEIWLALLIPMVTGVFFNYLTISKIAFNKIDTKNFIKFIFSYLLIYFLNYGLLKLLNSQIHNTILSQVLLLPIISISSYTILSKIVYK